MPLEFVEICLKWIEDRNAGDAFFGPWKTGEVICQHVGNLFVQNHAPVKLFEVGLAFYCASDLVFPMACDPCTG